MPETTEEKIAKSTGEDTVKYAEDLEKEADALIEEFYSKGEDGKEDGDKDDSTNDGQESDKQGDDEAGGEDADRDPEDEHGDNEKQDKEPDNTEEDKESDGNEETVEELRGRLEKAQKQAKDNKGEFTRRSQELSDSNKRSEHLEQNVFDLTNQVEALKEQLDKKVTGKTEKEVTKSATDITEKLKGIAEVDPDIAKAITPVIEDLVSQVSTLKTEIKTNSEKATKTANELIEDAHFKKIDDAHEGWENTLKTEEFQEYIDTLSPRQKRLALSDLRDGAADDIIEVLSDFKNSTQSTEDDNTDDDAARRKKNKVEKASKIANPKFDKSKDTNRKSQRFLFTQSEIAEMSSEEFAKKEDAIDNAMANNQIDLAN